MKIVIRKSIFSFLYAIVLCIQNLFAGDVQLKISQTALNNFFGAITTSRYLSYGNVGDGGLGITYYSVKPKSATIDIQLSNNFTFTFVTDIQANLNAWIVQPDFILSNVSLSISGTINLVSEGIGYKVKFIPTPGSLVFNTPSLPSWVTILLSNAANGYIQKLPEISTSSKNPLLPSIASDYFTSGTPTLTTDNDNIIISLTLKAGPRYITAYNDVDQKVDIGNVQNEEGTDNYISYPSPKTFDTWNTGDTHKLQTPTALLDNTTGGKNKYKNWFKDPLPSPLTDIALRRIQLTVGTQDATYQAKFNQAQHVQLSNLLLDKNSGGGTVTYESTTGAIYDDYEYYHVTQPHSINTNVPDGTYGFNWIWQNWSDGNTSQSRNIIIDQDKNLQALYKAHLGSNTLQATTGNTGRKVAIFDGKTYAVYTSAGCIWFIKNDGSGWSDEYPIDISGNAKNPSITTTNQGGCVYVVWEVNNSGTRTVYYRRSTNQGISWDNPINVSTFLGRNLTSVEDANPVVFGSSYAIVVFRAAQQPGQGCLYAWWHTNMFAEAILFPTHTNSYLPAGEERGYLGNYVYAYHLAFVYGGKIYYTKLNVNTQALHITNDTPVEIPGSSGGTNPTVSQCGDIGVAWENTSDHKIYYSQSTYTGSNWTTLPPITHNSHQLTQPSVNFDASDNTNIKVNLLWQCSSHIGMVSKPLNSSTWSSVVDLGTATGPNVTPQAWLGTPLTIQRTTGSVTPYRINIITLISGNNNTWSGERLIEGDVTVNAGATLAISPGAFISFANGAKLIVNGTLNANGMSSSRITLTRNGTTNWGGIQYNAGSSGSVSYCDISYAIKGIYCNGASPAISNNNITNCSGHGIYISNAAPYITWNLISYNGCGIFSQYSPQYIFLYHNTIIFNQGCGLDFYDTDVWLSPQFPYPNCCPGYGYNAIRQNGTGINAAFSSNVCLGQGIYECKNCVHDNTGLEINGAYGSNIYADQTFWNRPNPYHPLVSDYSLNYSSTFTHNSPLNYDPNNCGLPLPLIADGTSSELLNSPLQKTITVETTASVDEDLLQVVQLEIEGKLVEAIALSKFQWQNELKKSASSLPEEIVKRQAKKWQILGHLSFCYRMAGRNDFVDFLNKEIRPRLSIYDDLYAATIELENRYLVNNGNYEKAIENWNILKTRYAKNEAVYKYALYNLGYVYYEQFDDKAKGKEYFDELMTKYPDDELTLHCKLLFGETDSITNSRESISKKSVTSEVNIPDKIMLLDNYPNPFNPVTKIEYQLPEAARVSLKVYDMLGREVVTLVDEEKDAGYHATPFDGSRFSSGVYFTRFVVTPQEGKPFVQVKKMLLTK